MIEQPESLLLATINTFLTEQKPAMNEGWPLVTNEEMLQLSTIIQQLVDLKYERDCDGDTVIAFSICDTSRFHLLAEAIPHQTDVPNVNRLVKLSDLTAQVVGMLQVETNSHR